jgi:tetratricopeptide (TPR) repeat protein
MRFKGRRRDRELTAAIDGGWKLVKAGKDQEALDYLQNAVERFPESPEIRMLVATIYREFDFPPEEVAAQLAQAAILGSDDPVIQVQVGHRLLNGGDVEAARTCATRANKLIDGEFILTADLEGLVGRIAARDGDYALAEEKLRSALWREPEYTSHWLHLARFLWARARNEEALTVIDEALDRVGDIRDKKNLDRVRLEIINEGRP